jgi:HNH endonuclease
MPAIAISVTAVAGGGIRPGTKVMLGDKTNRVCRFCGKRPPDVTFRKAAHVIPEALGNKSIESAYECDVCNDKFGRGIENDLGKWSEPMRTFARIRGKSGVPTLKKGGDAPGWRIEYDSAGFSITSYEDDPLYDVDEASKQIIFKLKRGAHTPIAVLKAPFGDRPVSLLPRQSPVTNTNNEEMANLAPRTIFKRWLKNIRTLAPPIASFLNKT